MIAGDWESGLKAEALRAVGQAGAGTTAQDRVTYGDVAAGTARRAAFSPHVEHIGVLYSRASMDEALAWVDAAFGIVRTRDRVLDDRGPWILLLILGLVTLGRPLSSLLPVVAREPLGAGLSWRRLWPLIVVPALATPLLLRVVPTHVLPVLVGDYLAAHFAAYGLITLACLLWVGRRNPARAARRGSPAMLAVAVIAVTLYGLGGLGWAIDTYVTSFVPGPGRPLLVLAMLVGTLAYFLSDEWATRGRGAARGAYPASKLAFLVSLALAVGLDVERLFFLVIIVPVILVFFIIYGLFSRWTGRRTGHPFAAGFANAVIFAWAIGVTFPLMVG